jgi:Ca-activated chloride channel family protein
VAEEFILDCKLDQPAVLAGESADLYSLVTIRPNISRIGSLIEAAGDISLPAHLIVLVDVSQSMQTLIEDDPKARVVGRATSEGQTVAMVESSVPSRAMVAQRVVQRLAERLSADDRVTLVAFDHQAYVLGHGLPRGTELDNAIRALAETGGGGTSMGRAFHAVRAARPHGGTTGETQRIVLLTDGEDQEPEAALQEAESLGADFHLPIYAFGTGQSRADFLMQICKTTLGGAFRNITNEREAEDCFSEFLTTQKNILATNVSMRLWLSPEIFVRELYRTKPDVLFVGDMKPDADQAVQIPIEYMEKSKAYEFLFRCNVPARSAGRFRIARATLTYSLPALELADQRVDANIVVECTTDKDRAMVRVGDVRRVIGQAEVQRQLLFLQEKRDALESGRGTEKDRTIAARLLDSLIKKFQESGDKANENMYREMRDQLLRKGTISQDMMNRSLAASSKVEQSVTVQEIDDF